MNRVIPLVCATALAAVSTLGAQTWEPLTPNYSNLRGANYIPVYTGLRDIMPLGYQGVASSTALWRFYGQSTTLQEIDAQLVAMKQMGCNSVRVWLSHPVWFEDRLSPFGNRMTNRFAEFLARCATHNIYVMPVLWDAHCYGSDPCLEPDYNDPLGLIPPHRNISHWIPNPGPTKLAEFAASGWTHPDFVDYVTDMVNVGAASEATVMWDVMNEPKIITGDPNNQLALCIETMNLVEQLDPSTPITAGFTSVIDTDAGSELVRAAAFDVISIHTYGSFYENVHNYVQYAAAITDGFGTELNKPVILTEIGQPGWGQSYKDTVGYARDIVWGPPSAPTQHNGIGFYLFQSMIGWGGGNSPHKEKHGIFFEDFEVRDIDAALAVQQTALQQGVDPSTLQSSYVQKDPSHPLFYEQLPLPDGHDFVDTVQMLTLPSWFYATLPDEQGEDFADMMEIIGYDAAVLGEGPNPQVDISFDDFLLLLLCEEVYRTGELPGLTLTLEERNAVLDAWRYTLVPYVSDLNGPTSQEE